jgi:hypothetical protein
LRARRPPSALHSVAVPSSEISVINAVPHKFAEAWGAVQAVNSSDQYQAITSAPALLLGMQRCCILLCQDHYHFVQIGASRSRCPHQGCAHSARIGRPSLAQMEVGSDISFVKNINVEWCRTPGSLSLPRARGWRGDGSATRVTWTSSLATMQRHAMHIDSETHRCLLFEPSNHLAV